MHHRRPLVGAALALATVPLMLLVGEGALRLAPMDARAPHADRHYFCQFDAELGWVNRPNVRCTFKGHPLAINDLGLRDRNPAAETAKSSRRKVLLLGDSQVFGDGVALEETLGARLETRLSNVRTLNAGAIGYGGDQGVMLFERLADQVEPDLTILTLNAFDLRDHVATEIKGGYRKPRFVLNDENSTEEALRLEQVVPPSAKQRLARWLTQHSRLYMLVKRQHTRPAGAARREAARWDSPDAVFPENLDQSLAVTEALLARFHNDAARQQSRGAVVWLPYEMDYTNAEFRRRSDLVVSRLAERCRAIGLPLCDLRLALEADSSTPLHGENTTTPDEFFLDKLHFSPLGHARIAEALSQWLQQEKLLTSEATSATKLTHTPTPPQP